jgi:ferrous iron transport protein A
MKLKELNLNEIGVVVGYSTQDHNYRKKIVRMGLIKNTEFKVIRKAPLGDPIEIELRGFRLTLRGNEANVLEVEKR